MQFLIIVGKFNYTMCKEAPIIGIDLGTTYSCVAVVKGDQVVVIHGDNGSHTTASCVFINDKNGERVVGDAAKERSCKNFTNTVYGTCNYCVNLVFNKYCLLLNRQIKILVLFLKFDLVY